MDYFTADSKEDVSKLQNVFFSLISRELEEGDKIRPDENIPKLIAPNKILTSEERLELYARQYWWRILQSLQADFPVLKNILGKEGFINLSKKYILTYPSRSFTLRHLGRKLPDFIKEYEDFLSEDLKQLAYDVSVFELYQIESFFSAEGETLNDEESYNNQPDKILFSLRPHVFLLNLSYPVHEHIGDLKKKHLRDNETNATFFVSDKNELSVNNIPKSNTKLVMYRFESEVFAKPVEELEFLFLDYLSNEKTLPEIISHFASMYSESDIEEKVFNIFRKASEFKWLQTKLEE